MANLTETAQWEAGITRLETTDDVIGGESGTSNVQAKQLGNRLLFLKKAHDGVLTKSVAGFANVALTTAEANNGVIILTGLITASITVSVPGAGKWTVDNQTTTTNGNAYAVTFVMVGGTESVKLIRGKQHKLYCDGTNIKPAGEATQSIKKIVDGFAVNNWTEVANPKNFAIKALCNIAASNTNIAVGAADGTDAYLITSQNHGNTWTERANPKNFALNGVAAQGTNIIAVGAADGTDAYIVSSSIGSLGTWTERTNPKNIALNAIAYDSNNVALVAVGEADGTDAYIVRSINAGASWSEIANPSNLALKGIAFGNNVLVAVGTGYCIRSTDGGATWSAVSISGAPSLTAVAFGDGVFLAVGTVACYRSTDNGLTWTPCSANATTSYNSVAFANGVFVVVGSTNATSEDFMFSIDGGQSFSIVPSYKAISLNAVCDAGAGSRFIAAGNADGTDAYLLTSLRLSVPL